MSHSSGYNKSEDTTKRNYSIRKFHPHQNVYYYSTLLSHQSDSCTFIDLSSLSFSALSLRELFLATTMMPYVLSHRCRSLHISSNSSTWNRSCRSCLISLVFSWLMRWMCLFFWTGTSIWGWGRAVTGYISTFNRVMKNPVGKILSIVGIGWLIDSWGFLLSWAPFVK